MNTIQRRGKVNSLRALICMTSQQSATPWHYITSSLSMRRGALTHYRINSSDSKEQFLAGRASYDAATAIPILSVRPSVRLSHSRTTSKRYIRTYGSHRTAEWSIIHVSWGQNAFISRFHPEGGHQDGLLSCQK